MKKASQDMTDLPFEINMMMCMRDGTLELQHNLYKDYYTVTPLFEFESVSGHLSEASDITSVAVHLAIYSKPLATLTVTALDYIGGEVAEFIYEAVDTSSFKDRLFSEPIHHAGPMT